MFVCLFALHSAPVNQTETETRTIWEFGFKFDFGVKTD